jgi:hypothetical protein
MPIDPILLLVEEIRHAEAGLQLECNLNAQRYDHERADSINRTGQKIRTLYAELVTTAPTSALGASELIRIASCRLPLSHARHAYHLECIAERLGAGQRKHDDLIWLRAMVRALESGAPDGRDTRIAAILALAIRGAAQPILIHRLFVPPRASRPDLDQLSQGPTAFSGSVSLSFLGELK